MLRLREGWEWLSLVVDSFFAALTDAVQVVSSNYYHHSVAASLMYSGCQVSHRLRLRRTGNTIAAEVKSIYIAFLLGVSLTEFYSSVRLGGSWTCDSCSNSLSFSSHSFPGGLCRL